MLATGAADRHGQVVPVVARIVGQPARHEMIDVGIHALDFGKLLEVGDDLRIATAQILERRLVMRIGQAAHVEHQVRVERYAVLVTERLKEQRQARRIDADEILDPGAQRACGELAGIDVVAERAQIGERGALVFDRLGKRALIT